MKAISISFIVLIVVLQQCSISSFRLGMKPVTFRRATGGVRQLQAVIDPDHANHLASFLSNSFQLADAAVSAYSKVDKTGIIGFLATYIEIGIDLGKNLFQSLGVQNAYGPSILLFTMFGKTFGLSLFPLLKFFVN